MKQIYVVNGNLGPVGLYSQEQVDRFYQRAVRESWKRVTDLEAIGQRRQAELERRLAAGPRSYSEQSMSREVWENYIKERHRTLALEHMSTARETIDLGFQTYREARIGGENNRWLQPQEVMAYSNLSEIPRERFLLWV